MRRGEGDNMPLDEGGEEEWYGVGDGIEKLPNDLGGSWLERGLVEPVSVAARTLKDEEVTADDTPE